MTAITSSAEGVRSLSATGDVFAGEPRLPHAPVMAGIPVPADDVS
ncbi:hypothetical protein [Streptosporangium pseudovulgare]|nr:hypothetical protein [Streptosporangium pseudovulgare]